MNTAAPPPIFAPGLSDTGCPDKDTYNASYTHPQAYIWKGFHALFPDFYLRLILKILLDLILRISVSFLIFLQCPLPPSRRIFVVP